VQYQSTAAHTFFDRAEARIRTFLDSIGFEFFSVRQAVFFLCIAMVMSFSFTLNVGEQTAHLDSHVDSYGYVSAFQNDVLVPVGYTPMISGSSRSTIQEYAIQPGDTITSIAYEFDVSVATLKGANGLISDVIRPGEVLRILPTTGLLYTVKAGDSLGKIAGKFTDYGVNEKILVRQNNITSDVTLVAGTEMIIPGVEPMIQKDTRNIVYTETPVYRPASKASIAAQGGAFIWPTQGKVTQGVRRGHVALDIGNKTGTAIYASCDGIVQRAATGWNGGYGNVIVIDCGGGYKVLNAHLYQFNIKKGEHVRQGQQIGLMGNTGRSTGPHLHFEIIKGKQKFDPTRYLP
jgi:murein DD-endopeptidase MepM/ murein hydrolase activator NlpD